MTEHNGTRTPLGVVRSLKRYQRVLIYIYLGGFVAMLLVNISCYPGTYIGRIGWAAIWPLSAPAFLWEYGFSLNDEVVRQGCIFAENAVRVLP